MCGVEAVDFLDVYTDKDEVVSRKVRFCNNYWNETMGLRFVKDPEGGAYFPIGGAVDMLFCKVPLRIIWLTKNHEYISEAHAYPWHPLYLPPWGTGKILELPVSNTSKFAPKQRLVIKPI